VQDLSKTLTFTKEVVQFIKKELMRVSKRIPKRIGNNGKRYAKNVCSLNLWYRKINVAPLAPRTVGGRTTHPRWGALLPLLPVCKYIRIRADPRSKPLSKHYSARNLKERAQPRLLKRTCWPLRPGIVSDSSSKYMTTDTKEDYDSWASDSISDMDAAGTSTGKRPATKEEIRPREPVP
jgi:hypothetical protein